MQIEGKYGVELIFFVPLITKDSQALKASPTLAAGDVKISGDGGAFANLNTLPSVAPAGGEGG